MQSTMENPNPNPNPQTHSSSPRLFSQLAWKASLLFWRRLLKKGPSKSSVSKSSQGLPHTRVKSTTSKRYYMRSNSNHFYYSSPTHDSDDETVYRSMHGCYHLFTNKARSRPCSGYATPIACDYSPDHLSHISYGGVPYFQLRPARTLPPARLPIYIVS
ncbi:hypothetical protein L7F22_010417 [Adiantum nelumboides]|nr:hypothetical protein [Adiantum nelumboides]